MVICRCGGIGHVLCTLPMCDEVRRRHPKKLLVFITAPIWREVVTLSRAADVVYANRWWIYLFRFPTNVKLFGLVDRTYNPQTTGERSSGSGTSTHLINDLAASCGLMVTARLPRLCPSHALIEKTRLRFGLDCETIATV